MEKKEWSEPELIVLVRSKPEEAVLTACKGAPYTPETPPPRHEWLLPCSVCLHLRVQRSRGFLTPHPLIPWVLALGNP